MSTRIPSEWWEYQNNPAFYITYFGEVYYGYLWDFPEINDRFYIVQNSKVRTVRNLKAEDRTTKKLREVAREVVDPRVIAKIIPGDSLGSDMLIEPISYSGKDKFKKMFVFGAAASAYCVFGEQSKLFNSDKLRPPIGTDLFHSRFELLINEYPAARSSLSWFESKSYNIEECLQEEWSEVMQYYQPRIAIQHLNLQYYLQDLFSQISRHILKNHNRGNLYSLFLRKLRSYLARNANDKISLVSFNYDFILDELIEEVFGYTYNDISNYVDHQNHSLLLFKPHGSCNWGWQAPDVDFSFGVGQNKGNVLYHKQVEPWQVFYQYIGEPDQVIASNSWGHSMRLHPSDLGSFSLRKDMIRLIPNFDGPLYVPALLLPYRDKDDFVMPYRHSDVMSFVADEMEELYLIGWKGNEDLFNSKILTRASKLKRIIIVNPEPLEVKNYLKRYLRLDMYEIREVENFEKFVQEELDSELV